MTTTTTDFGKVILSASGKGGVGKSLLAVNLALRLAENNKVGLLDMDTKSPNDTYILNIKGELGHDEDRRILPLRPMDDIDLQVMSTALLFPAMRGITLPGEEVRKLIRQTILDVNWGERIDYLVCDLDPSSGDSLLTLSKLFVGKICAIIITSSDISSINDCQRMIHSCIVHEVPIVGMIANMVGSECPKCGKQIVCAGCGEIITFGSENVVKDVAENWGVNYIGAIKFNPSIKRNMDIGKPILPNLDIIDEIIKKIGLTPHS